MTATRRATRAGFTMVELLVVVAIIAVLAALLLTAVGSVRARIRVSTTTADITQMQAALDTFKTTYGFLPPSHVTITSGPSAGDPRTAGVWRFRWPTNAAEPEFALLRRMFPRWNPAVGPSQGGDATTWANAPFRFKDDASGDLDLDQMKTALAGAAVPPAAPYAFLAVATNPRVNPNAVPLDSNQLLVLFLGGPTYALTKTTLPDQTSPVAYGLASYGTGWDTAGPTAPLVASSAKKGPAYDIPPSKLTTDFGGVVPRLVDGWGTPFAYFVSAGPNYDARVPFPWPAGADAAAPATYDGLAANNFSSDQNKATTFTAHAVGSGGKWMNQGGYQILSAGPDKLFGPGSFFQPGNTPPLNTTPSPVLLHVWDAKNPQGGGISATYYGEGGGSTSDSNKLARGADDLSNFNGGGLGTAGQ